MSSAPLKNFSIVWPQLGSIFGFIYFLELTLQRLALLGPKFRLSFSCCQLPTFCMDSGFFNCTQQVVRNTNVDAWSSPQEFYMLSLECWSPISISGLVLYLTLFFSFTRWLGLLTLTLMLVLLLGTISFLPALQTVHSVIGDISRLSPLCSWDTQRLAQVCFFFLSDFSQEHVWLGGRSTIMMEGIYTTVWQELLVTSFSAQIYLLYLHKTQIYSKTQKQSSLGNLFFPSFLPISRDKAKLPLLPCTMIP